MSRIKYDKYTKIALSDVHAKYKRAVKIKDELIPFEADHFLGKGDYKRIQMRYDTKNKRAQLIFLGYDANDIMAAIQSGTHTDFNLDVDQNKIDYNASGLIRLNPISMDTNIYEYSLTKYVPFSSDSYKIFSKLSKKYYPEGKLHQIDNPILLHFLLSHLYLHIGYLTDALSIYNPDELSTIKLQISGKANHYVENFKSKESAFHLTFSSNIWLPPDLNIGNHVAYGFGQLQLVDQWIL